MSYQGYVQSGSSKWTINTVNHLREENQLVLFNQHNGKYTHTNAYGTEVLIELENGYEWGSNKTLKAKVLKIEKGIGNMAIPKGKVVLSGHGTGADELNQLSIGDEVDVFLGITLNANNTINYTQMTGGDNYATMLLNGVVEQSSVWNELHPRTGLGYSQTGDTLIFCVVDGRGVSIGATTKQLAQIMKSAGAYTAFNMDGGGSSCMYVAEYGGPVNKTSDGTERAVANSIFVVSTAPTDNEIVTIKPYKSSISLPIYGEYTPQFRAYNQYGVLLTPDLQNVVLTCPASLGTIEGNKFIATGHTPGNIIATYNGNITATIAVNFEPVSKIQIRLDSVIVDNRKEYPVEVVATTTSGDTPISSNALSWSVDNN
ncbi:MAG: phosphodiester glycosidase family protein [Paludibacteraceae bacterium]